MKEYRVKNEMVTGHPNHIAALIVAAGLSSRMGDFKPMLPLGESTIIRTVIGKLKSVGCQSIVLVTGHRAAELERHVADLDVLTVKNPEYVVSDMFSSVKLGLRALPEATAQLFFLPGDIPLFSPDTLLAMKMEMAKTKREVVIPVHEGRRGHPLLISRTIVPEILDYRGEMGLKGALARLNERSAFLEVRDAGVTLDADRPEEYRRLQEIIQSERSASARS